MKDTPQGKLVQMSMEHPELIDAGFISIIQQYASQKNKLANQTIVTDHMLFHDKMKYKAILDIDGNHWSGRYPRLLCTNNVIIKV